MKFLITETHGPYKAGMIHEPKKENIHVWRGRSWAKPYKGENTETATKQPTETAAIEHVGGGWYRLPNGEKVQGKKEAEKAARYLG